MDQLLLLKAAEFAADKHRDQRRKGQEASPYINHPIQVALVLSQIGQIRDVSILVSALLHDTLEDTKTTAEELKSHFGAKVCAIVAEVTDDQRLSGPERKQVQIEKARHLSYDAAVVKLGDKICNVVDIIKAPPIGWSIDRRRCYVDWAESVIAQCPRTNKPLEMYFAETVRWVRDQLAEDEASVALV